MSPVHWSIYRSVALYAYMSVTDPGSYPLRQVEAVSGAVSGPLSLRWRGPAVGSPGNGSVLNTVGLLPASTAAFRAASRAAGRSKMADGGGGAPLFTFGVIADVQYADLDNGSNFTRTRTRYYRSSLQLLREALQHWARPAARPRFVLQLGDLIDGFNGAHGTSRRALDTVLKEFSSSGVEEVHHVWGNHELYNFTRAELLRSRLNSQLHLQKWPVESCPKADLCSYSFSPHPGFTFIVLDGYDVSLLGLGEDSEPYQRALRLLQKHNSHTDLNTPPSPTPSDPLLPRYTKFNGGFSDEQLDWLDSVLSLADQRQEQVTVVSHLPVHPDSTEPMCLAWNHGALLRLLRRHRSVVLFVAGHDHDGGYCRDAESGAHHLTVAGVIETPPHSRAFCSVAVFPDRMELTGHGRVSSRVLNSS